MPMGRAEVASAAGSLPGGRGVRGDVDGGAGAGQAALRPVVQVEAGRVWPAPPWAPLGWGGAGPTWTTPLGTLWQPGAAALFLPTPPIPSCACSCLCPARPGCSENRRCVPRPHPTPLNPAPPACSPLGAVALFYCRQVSLGPDFRWGLSSGRRQEGTCRVGICIWGAAPPNCPGDASEAQKHSMTPPLLQLILGPLIGPQPMCP